MPPPSCSYARSFPGVCNGARDAAAWWPSLARAACEVGAVQERALRLAFGTPECTLTGSAQPLCPHAAPARLASRSCPRACCSHHTRTCAVVGAWVAAATVGTHSLADGAMPAAMTELHTAGAGADWRPGGHTACSHRTPLFLPPAGWNILDAIIVVTGWIVLAGEVLVVWGGLLLDC